ncbi:MAG: TRC40/GET3/ArsA family transport-energizing ATPase [Anaerococcus sp.]
MKNKKIIIFTGKGGVGKSSISSATAIKSSKQLKKTILISTDNAHSLSDLFNTEQSDDIIHINKNLDLLEINSEILLRENFPSFKESISKLYPSSGLNNKNIGNKFSIPGLENLVNLIKIKDIYESNQYENIIVDCPPTGSTISLLKLPEMLSWYLEKFFPIGKKIVRVLNPVSQFKYNVSLPSKEGINDVETFYYKLLDLQNLLKNKEVTCIRLVTLPEKMVVEETKRNYMYLNLYDYNVDRIFINRIYEGFENNSFIQKTRLIQEKYIKILEDVFSDKKIHKIKRYPKEIHGIDSIVKLLEDSLDIEDLLDISNNNQPQSFIKYDNGYILEISSLGLEDTNYKINKIDSDISISLNNFKRLIPLPNILSNSFIEKTDISDKKIKIYLNNGESK